MRGFTLIEMLIVVGIIAVLVSVSIPMVNSSLERARIATDMANERAARAAALVKYLEDDLDDDDSRIFSYDAVTGTLSSYVPYSRANCPAPYGKCREHNGCFLFVYIGEDGACTLYWDSADYSDHNLETHLYPVTSGAEPDL